MWRSRLLEVIGAYWLKENHENCLSLLKQLGQRWMWFQKYHITSSNLSLLSTTNILRQIALTHILTRKHERAKYNVWFNLELCQSVYLHRKEIGTCSRKYKLLGVWVIKLFLPQNQQNGIIFIVLMSLFTHFLLLLVSSLSPSHVCSLLPTLSKQNWFYKTK